MQVHEVHSTTQRLFVELTKRMFNVLRRRMALHVNSRRTPATTQRYYDEIYLMVVRRLEKPTGI